jgi:Na+/H+ antiporter NhaD/arsenite permease-like protein
MTNTIIALAIFVVTFYFIISGRINRTIISLVGATVMIVCGMIFQFYTQEQALLSIDFNTVGLLMGMMIIVSVMKKSGLFSYIAIKTAKISKGSPMRLMIFMGIMTAFISMALDNVTTIILVVPITILVCDILGISSMPPIMAVILLSNIGGSATLVGDPPNMMIASASDFVFTDFLMHLLPIALLVMLISILLLRFIFRAQLSVRPKNVEAVYKIDESEALRDKATMIKSLVALIIVFILFFLQRQLGLHHSFIAIIGAGLTLLLVRPNIDEILKDVEWSVLLFFCCLFVIVGGLENAGFLSLIADRIAALATYNVFLAKMWLLWVSAFTASLIDRVPFTAAMIPVIKQIGNLGISTDSLWWVLALGVGFGGNGTPIGSIVGVVGLSLSEQTKAPIDFKTWLSSGTIVMIVSIIVVSLLLVFI